MMGDLESLREIFADTRLHIGIGTIKKLGLANDKSVLRLQVNMLPDNREIIATMGFGSVGAGTGFVEFPEVDDLVLVAFVDGHPDEAFVIKQISTSEELIPTFAQSGHMVAGARPGKKLYLSSDTKVSLSRTATEPTEPLVLGNVLVSFLTAVLNDILNSPQLGLAAGGIPVALDPGIRTAIMAHMTTYLTTTSTNIVSQIAFTERGT